MMHQVHRNCFGPLRLFALLSALACTSCRHLPHEPLHSAHLVDQGGGVQVIASGDRLRALEKRDFATPQPYKKILRTFLRDAKGCQKGIITSYFPNGLPMQLLEICDGRAYGAYREWHNHGGLRIAARVVGGAPDLTPIAQATWLFDGLCTAWDAQKRVCARVTYQQGLRDGWERAYGALGFLRKEAYYSRGVVHGESREFDENGQLRLTTQYKNGKKCGKSIGYWAESALASREEFIEDRLVEAKYWDRGGQCVGRVAKGDGWRIVFAASRLAERQRIVDGAQQGPVEFYRADGSLARIAHFRNGQLDGRDTDYFEVASFALRDSQKWPRGAQPYMEVVWRAGMLQGPVRTWYANGQLRSCHERDRNKREGFCTCYYPSGRVMLVEEYRADRLITGRYFDECAARSRVVAGRGIAMLYDASGQLLRRIEYEGGLPKIARNASSRDSVFGAP